MGASGAVAAPGEAVPRGPLVLDAAQRAVVDAPPGSGPLVVLGAPGTGKTTVLVEALVARVEVHGADPSSLLVLAPGRRAAAALRDRVSARLARTTTQPLARTPQSYAFGLLRRAAQTAGGPPPRLVTGPEQVRLLAELLAGHEAGDGHPPPWPASCGPQVRALDGFAAELRDLLARALEGGLAPADLADLGARTGRPEWTAAASVLAEHLDVVALASPGAHDPAAVVRDATALLRADPALLAAERDRWSLVAVEDHQESTPSTAELLDLVAGGRDLLVVGDPDTTTSGFRGGDPALLATAADRHRGRSGGPARTAVLTTRWRHGPVLAAVSERVAARTGSVGVVAHRGAAPARTAGDGVVEGHVLGSAGRQAAFVASVLRAEHVLGGTPWAAMAVVVRSAAATAVLRRALGVAGVPVVVPPARAPLRAEPAVAALLLAARVVLRDGPPTPAEALALLSSPFGTADGLVVRRLRRALLTAERAAAALAPDADAGAPARAGAAARTSDELLAAVLGADPQAAAAGGLAGAAPLLDAVLRSTAAPARRVSRMLAAGREAAGSGERPVAGGRGAAAGPQEVLWALWSASGLADRWRERALAGGPAGERADADLDAVVALFDVASRTVERAPGTSAAQFTARVLAEDVASDTLAARAPTDEAVALLTPAAALGREWDVVVVPGLQEGAWPDTRLRSTLLGAQDLADVLAGRAGEPGASPRPASPGALAAARRVVLDDERRTLHVAVTRARRRLVVTAVRDDDERPSSFLDLVAPRDDGPDAGERPLTPVPRASSLPALVAELRGVLLTPLGVRDAAGAVVDATRRAGAASALARLAAAGVPGADPGSWHGLAPVSDTGPLHGPDDVVRVSPSAVSSFSDCSLRWLLEASGGRPAASVSQGVGTLVHAVAAAVPDGTPAQMAAELERLWPQLGLPDTWVGRREQRRAAEAVRRLAGYVAAARAAGRSVVDVEVEVSAQIGRALVVGRLDRLERDEQGRTRVVDLKTGAAPTRAELARHPQLGLYQAVVEAGGLASGPAASGGAALVQVGAGRKEAAELEQAPLAESDEPGWARDLLAATAEGMAASAFEARANHHCPTCPVRTSCPLQGAV